MPSFDTIKDTIYDVINGLALVPDGNIEYQYQNSPHPDKPYFSLLLNSFRKIAEDSFTDPNGSGNSDMVGNREFTLMVYGFGPGIVEATYKLQSELEKPDIYDLMVAGGVIPYDVDSPIQDISGIDESENEERSSYDILCRIDSIITDVSVGLIEIVNAEGTYKQAGTGDIIRNLHIDST